MFNIFNSTINKSTCDERHIEAEVQDTLDHIRTTGAAADTTQEYAKHLVETTLNLHFAPVDLAWNKFLVRCYLGLKQFKNNPVVESITAASILGRGVSCISALHVRLI